jgi:hypothetical protein
MSGAAIVNWQREVGMATGHGYRRREGLLSVTGPVIMEVLAGARSDQR